MKNTALGISSLLAAMMAMQAAAAGEEWTQWRGAGRDGVVSGFKAPAQWPEKLGEVWKVEVGEGHASPVVSGERVFVHARREAEGEEVVLALDLASGRELWRSSYPAPYEMSAVARAHGKGPKATPVLSGGRLYTLGISGILSCFDAAKGDMKWVKEFSKEFSSSTPLYGTASSPLIDRGLLIAAIGGHDSGALAAFDAETGQRRWTWTDDGPGYSSPVIAELAGERQAIVEMQRSIIGVAVPSGKLLWRIPFKTPYDQNIPTPLLYQDTIILSGLEQGTAAVRIQKEGDGFVPREVWKNDGISMYMSSPVLEGSLLFGFTNKKKGSFFCLEAATGKLQWQSDGDMGDNAALLIAPGTLFALTSRSRLLALKPAADGFERLAEFPAVAPTPTWAHPVILQDRILIKDHDHLICLKL